MRIEPQQKPVAVLAGIVAVLLVVGATLHITIVAQRARRVAQLQQQVRHGRESAVMLLSTHEQVAQLRREVVQFERSFPDAIDVGALLERLGEDLASQVVTQQEIQARNVVEGVDFNRIPLTLQFRGSFSALFGFLKRIEAHERIVRIDRITVMRENRSGDGLLNVVIELSTFSRATQEQPS